ncbi:MAG TPA: hypothetical protein VGS79_15270 [Puia sp.]|nr:hypothetical protein [Puia sp.]
MKCLVFGVLILMSSCKDHLKSLDPENPTYPVWNIYDSTAQIHKYLPSGLLDSTLKTWYRFQNGTPVDHIDMLITRTYDAAGKLTEEQDFTYSKRSKKWMLDGKNIKKYDTKGNMILNVSSDIKNSRSTMIEMTKLEYNQNNQEIHRMEIRKDLEEPSNWNLDSVIAHENDTKPPKYDTTLISSSYDSDGNLVKKIDGNPKNPNTETLSTIYAHGIKKLTYGINPSGDTILDYRYEKDGNLLKQITDYRKPVFDGQSDTIWYSGNRTVKRVDINKKLHFRGGYILSSRAK